MPFTNVTEIILNNEVNELREAYASDSKIKEAINQFDAECRLRHELTIQPKQDIKTV